MLSVPRNGALINLILLRNCCWNYVRCRRARVGLARSRLSAGLAFLVTITMPVSSQGKARQGKAWHGTDLPLFMGRPEMPNEIELNRERQLRRKLANAGYRSLKTPPRSVLRRYQPVGCRLSNASLCGLGVSDR
jgi:hypothetical protein